MGHVNFKNVSLIPETSAHFNRVSNVINRERSNFRFTSNGRREFVPRDQVSHLLVIYCSLFLHISCNFLSTRILLSSFYLLIFYFEKFSNWICCLPFAVYVELKLSNVHAVLLMQNIVMATVKFSLDNIEQKSCRPLRKKKKFPINFKRLLGLKITSIGEIHISQGLDWASHYSLLRIYSIVIQRTNQNTKSFWITAFLVDLKPIVLFTCFATNVRRCTYERFFSIILSSTLLGVEARNSLTK